MKTSDLAFRHHNADAMPHNWHTKFGSRTVSETRKLRALEDKSSKLNSLLADSMLDNSTLIELASKKKIEGSNSQPDAATLLNEQIPMSGRWDSERIKADHQSLRYRSIQQHNTLRTRMPEPAHDRRWGGYSDLFIMLLGELGASRLRHTCLAGWKA